MPNNTLLIVAVDGTKGTHPAVERAVLRHPVVDVMPIRVIYHPFSCSNHKSSWPGDDAALNIGFKGDQYGNPRSGWATCLKHMWWWTMNYVWDRLEVDVAGKKEKIQKLLFLEDDFLLTPDFYQTLQSGFKLIRKTRRVFGVKIQGSSRTFGADHNMIAPVAFHRTAWERIRSNARKFCYFDDYNWDLSLRHLWASGAVMSEAVLADLSRVGHAGKCNGWDKGHNLRIGGSECEQKLKDDQERFLRLWENAAAHRRESLSIATVNKNRHRGNGGWAHPRDQQHCYRLSTNQTYVASGFL